MTAWLIPPGAQAPDDAAHFHRAAAPWCTSTVLDALRWFEACGQDHLIWQLLPGIALLPGSIDKMRERARAAGASIVYADYHEQGAGGGEQPHPLIDYQPGSLRDDFAFGGVVLLAGAHLAGLASELEAESFEHGGWYDLRLRLSERGPVVRIHEPLYRLPHLDDRPSGQQVFDYVNPGRRDYQLEMERVATAHLRRIGACLDPPDAPPVTVAGDHPVTASVVIPVRDRARTIKDAVGSALAQQTPFNFNVIVVDNHSTDGTTDVLADIARSEPRLVHLVPDRTDLLIGGCWNLAIHSPACGRYAVQLDSDDLYDGDEALARIVDALEQGPLALVVGSYTTVDFDLKALPPGLVDHREWTDANGHNNLLRVAGLGAPRAFHVPTLRTVGFPNVSYGEDYAVALKLCRTYRVGRIYESLYWCRRWEENTDSALTLEQKNRYDAYKDSLRSAEIAARQR